MGKSLKEQLLDLELAPNPDHRKGFGKTDRPPQTAAKGEAGNQDISLHQAYRIRNQQERQQKEKIAALKREQHRLRRETNQKIRKLVDEFAIRDETADSKRNFLFKGRIRSVLVTPDQIRAINEAALGIVYLSGNYHVMPIDKVTQIRQFAPEHVPDLQAGEAEDEQDHPVPDNLHW